MKKYYVLILLLAPVFFMSCFREDKYVKSEGMIWNTVYHITYKGDPALADSILPVLDQVGSSLSVFDENSLLSQLNENENIRADYHLIKVYDAAVQINRISKGNFDPTISPLIDAWGFGKGHTPTTDTLAIDSILHFVGISKTHREGEMIFKDDKRIKFNLSAIAKGYGSDAVGEMLKRNGVKDYMVEIGGEISMSGKNPEGKDWKIAIDAPNDDTAPGEETSLILQLTDCGVATSGNYRNYRMEGEKKVAHTISPITGRPVLSEILSATIIARSCMEADALATACMAGTPQDAFNLVKTSGCEAILIFADSVWQSPGINKYIISL